jgi:hypothetical protein
MLRDFSSVLLEIRLDSAREAAEKEITGAVTQKLTSHVAMFAAPSITAILTRRLWRTGNVVKGPTESFPQSDPDSYCNIVVSEVSGATILTRIVPLTLYCKESSSKVNMKLSRSADGFDSDIRTT